MRSAGDMPQRRRVRRSTRSRVVLLVIAALIVVALTSLRGIAGFYTDYLWFREVGFTPVWRGVLGAKVLLAVFFTILFFVLLWASLTIADRLAPRFRPLGSEDELVQRYRDVVGPHAGKLHAAVAVLFALIFGLGTSSQWQSWLLFRHAVSFGVKDPQFHKDVGFFVFRVPFLSFLVDWAFVAIVIVTFLTVVAHYLNGGIRLPQGPAERVTPQVKAHVSVLLAGLALVKAAGYWLQRYQLATSRRGTVEGPTYTDIHAQLPAIRLLLFISLVAFVLLLVNIWRQGWVLPGIAVGLWLLLAVLVGGAYPAFIQKFRVQPSEIAKERPYILRNIAATRAALGISGVQDNQYQYSTDLTSTDLANDADTIRNVRLWDPAIVEKTFKKIQEIRAYYQFNDVDVDRYTTDKVIQTNVAARELNPDGVPSQSWVNKRLQFTHGYGAVLSPTNAVTGDGLPDFLVKDIPPIGDPKISQPRIYYGENNNSYAVVHSGQRELDFQSVSGRTENSSYTGKGGVLLNSYLRRFAFFLRFSDYNLLISNLVTSQSKVMYIRNIGDRVRKVAPFLRYDADPYPVILGGRIVYVQDAYTVTSRYPYAQSADNSELPDGSGLSTPFNYIRNSVKITIDAYDGTMHFYVMDTKDPLLRAYGRMFPDLFTPRSEMPVELLPHLRYPEDMFRVQTNMYGRYHITDPNDFYNKADAWNVAQNPAAGLVTQTTTPGGGAQTPGAALPAQRKRMDPTYLLLHLPGDPQESFLVLRPFVPVSQGDKQQNLTAFMTAKSDPNDYGKLQNFVMPRGAQVDGPALIDSRIASNELISKEISLLGTGGSRVEQGNLLVIPIKTSLLYVRPLYVESDTNPLPELRKVIVVYANQAAMGDTLQEALTTLFGAAPPTLEQKAPTGGTATKPSSPTNVATIAQLLAQADQDFADADAALKAGDLATYQAKIKDAQAKVAQARQLSSQSSSTTATTAPNQA